MSGYDDLFEPFDDIIEGDKPLDDVGKEDVWGNPDSWNSGKEQDIWSGDDKWDTKDIPKDDRKVFRHEPKKPVLDPDDGDLEWDEQDEDDYGDLGIDDGF